MPARRTPSRDAFEVIGEAAGQLRRVAPELERRDPALTLSKAYGARNLIVRGYAGVDYGVLWATASDAVPLMVNAARAALQSWSRA